MPSSPRFEDRGPPAGGCKGRLRDRLCGRDIGRPNRLQLTRLPLVDAYKDSLIGSRGIELDSCSGLQDVVWRVRVQSQRVDGSVDLVWIGARALLDGRLKQVNRLHFKGRKV